MHLAEPPDEGRERRDVRLLEKAELPLYFAVVAMGTRRDRWVGRTGPDMVSARPPERLATSP